MKNIQNIGEIYTVKDSVVAAAQKYSVQCLQFEALTGPYLISSAEPA
jgi:hypothetical protein